MSIRYLADTSAWHRMHHPDVRDVLEPLIMQGELGRCTIIDMEVLYSARSAPDYMRMRSLLRDSCDLLSIDQHVFDRAQDVQGMLAQASRHRVALAPELFIAACAERHGVTVVHYDSDFDHVASVTEQPVEWVVPRGSVR